MAAPTTAPTIAFRFDATNEDAQRVAEQFAGDLIEGLTAETLANLRHLIARVIREGMPAYEAARAIQGLIGLTAAQGQAALTYREDLINRGLTLEQVNTLTDTYAAKLLEARARTIARTEIMDALNTGQAEAWREAQAAGYLDAHAEKEWIATDGACDECAGYDGDTVPVDEDFPDGDPPLHPSCVPGDRLVLAGSRIAGASKRWFNGDLIVFRVACGRELACTPYHPILTPAGWLGACLVNVGSHVVCDGRRQWRGVTDRDHQQMPAAIQDVADAIFQSSQVTPAPVPVAAEDFHGDGRGSEVAIIGTNRQLRDRSDAAISQPAVQHALGWARPRAALFTEGSTTQLLDVDVSASGGRVGVAHLSSTRGVVETRPFQRLGLGLGAEGHTLRDQASRDERPADTELARQLIDGRAGPVFADEVIFVERFAFHGFIYNLETADGWYAADGIITHNCRCTIGLAAGGVRQAA
jgi:hypothetical protein